MTNVKIDIDNQAVTAAFNRLLQLGQNPRPALEGIGGELLKNIQQGFEAGVSPYGQKWAPLKHRSGKPLLDSGKLHNSISYRVVGNAVEIGTNRPYAKVHQFGAEIERAAYSKQIRHRTDAKGNLLRTKLFGGKGLIFAKDSHARAQTRWVEVGAHKIAIPARPFLPTDGLPDSWRDDVIDVVMDVIRRQVE